MKIAVNTRLLIDGKLSGIGWFAYHTLKRIVQNNPQHQFIFLFDRKYDEQFIFAPNVIPEVVFPPTRHPVLQHIWFNYSIIPVLKKHKPDLFYSPEGYGSLRAKTIPTLIVLHDINFHHHPSDVPFADNWYWSRYFPVYARCATRLLTVSEFSKQDISRAFGIPPEKIVVTCNGADDIFQPVFEKEKQRIKNEIAAGSDYFICVGALLPRKNIARLIRAFGQFRKASAGSVKLVIAGERMCLTSEMERAFNESEFSKDIVFTGRLSPERLRLLMGSALALTFVSYFEGFGIPVIEAMSAGIPVIASNTSSMPEVAGDAAFSVDPFSVESIAGAMQSVASDASLRKMLIEKGYARKNMFTWDKSAGIIWQTMVDTINAYRGL